MGNFLWRVNGYFLNDYTTLMYRDAELKIYDWLSKHSYNFYANAFAGALVAQFKRFVGSLQRMFEMMYFEIYR